MNRSAWLRVTLGVTVIFAVLTAWVLLNLDTRTCDQLVREVAQNRIPDRCWR